MHLIKIFNQLRTLQGIHDGTVGSLAWNNYLLTTGGEDGAITNNDVRIQSHVVQTYSGHQDDICGLKWSTCGKLLASGGADKLLHIWDVSRSSPLHRFDNHRATVRAIAWSPFQSNLLASGGGEDDNSIKFWDASTGTCLNSVNTGSMVCGLLWSKNERELLSSHGLRKNQLTLWNYPSMSKMAELNSHASPVLYMAQSPDGCKVASASPDDERLNIWNIFDTAKEPESFSFGPSNRSIR